MIRREQRETGRRARTAALAVGLLLVVVAPGVASADIFSFTDDEGVVHYTNKSNDPRARLVAKSSSRKVKLPPGVTPFAPSDTSVDRFTRVRRVDPPGGDPLSNPARAQSAP